MLLGDEPLRALLDPHGLLAEGRALPALEQTYLIYGQRGDGTIPISLWRNQADRFFGAKLGWTVEKRYEATALPERDAASLMVFAGERRGTRAVITRPSTPDDHALAEALEHQQGTYGLALLARRCPRVWLVESEGPWDPVSLLVAAVIASVELGPIVDPGREALFGVKTARAKLDAP